MSIRQIHDSQELQEHIHALLEIAPLFAAVYEQVGLPKLRRRSAGFDALLRTIVGQQLSTKAADSIYARLAAVQLCEPQRIAQADDETLRSCGLSWQKAGYVRSLLDAEIDFIKLAQMPDEAVIETLTAVKGIGRWSAQMYLLFSLGRADVLAVDDLAIKVASQSVLGLEHRPTPKQLQSLSEPWSPYRSAASLLLWEYYATL